MAETEEIDIWSGAEWPACALSNLAAHAFVLDGVSCASMEGLLQSLKYPDEENAGRARQMTGRRAKLFGRHSGWKQDGILYWRDRTVSRHSPEYQQLLDNAYTSLFNQSAAAARALRATGDAVLVHNLGSDDPTATVLTAEEFCSRLVSIRDGLSRSHHDIVP